ncbi:MAG TPA: methyltransferase domain-containing protein [Gaiellaceae bacterium]|nr:methyltransferase domain-containing protein [Gaiellaceae bacterium]
MENVRVHFRKKASSFDRLYDEDNRLERGLRPALSARREFALAVAGDYAAPSVLDVGCGSGRVGEELLAAGASKYVGIDFSEPMLALARKRLAHFGERARLVEGDFLETELERTFDLVVLLGVFDYTPDPQAFVARARRACSGSVVGSFPRWTWLKGPLRKVRYEVVNDCPIFNYTESQLRSLFGATEFSRCDIVPRGRGGYLVRADV